MYALGPVTRKLVREKTGPGGPLLAAKIGPTRTTFGWSAYFNLQGKKTQLSSVVKVAKEHSNVYDEV